MAPSACASLDSLTLQKEERERGAAGEQQVESDRIKQAKASAAARRADKLLSIAIAAWELSDARSLVEPHIQVSVVDGCGSLVEQPQQTAVSRQRDDSAVVFDTRVDIKTPLNKMNRRSAIFLELQHTGQAQEVATRCYCYMELDELTAGAATLDVYAPPTDLRRDRKPALLAGQPGHLHLHLDLQTLS